MVTSVMPSTFWRVVGSPVGAKVRVVDVVDGPSPVVLYELTDNYNDRARGMMSETEFLRRFEQVLPDPRL